MARCLRFAQSCASDYSKRLYRKSPIRGFRTGFSRLNQLLAKELFYTLAGTRSRKLVVFSDSRKDAASTANDMERMHYLDSSNQFSTTFKDVFVEGNVVAWG